MHITNPEDVTALLIGNRWYNVEPGTVTVYGDDLDETVSFQYRDSRPVFGTPTTGMTILASRILGEQHQCEQ